MKKSNKLVTALIVSAMFSGSAIAASEGKSVNQELSDVRVKISKQMLENKLYQAQLDGLQKQKEIQGIKDSLDGVSSTSSGRGVKNEVVAEDHTFKFNEAIHEEDILSEGNNWKQSVGFIYQDDLDIGGSGSISIDSPIDELTNFETDLDFEKMLKEVANESGSDNDEDENVQGESLSNVNDFKLISVELSKLNIYEDKRKGSVKVNYITNNGYQKIRGSKIVNVVEGSSFNIKGKAYFEILSINDTGIEYKNIKTGEIKKATR